ncbi:hypothetical protein [Streptomyces sp. NBC_00035]|uniref:hypothetical protein n=1 Tax=Streptomyces sp. NBC_00035 TaxID=2903614 RepID=UPI0032505413
MWNREEFEEPARITTRVERQLAVSHWLLSASREVEGARAEWAEIGLTVLRCGTLFGAVRVPAEIIHAAAGSHQDDAVNAYLARALHGGPVLVDTHQERYYALVPPGTMHHWNTPDTECLGRGSYLGVPRPDLDGHSGQVGRSYWSVPMDSPGELCTPGSVTQLVAHGRYRRQTAQAEEEVEP